MNSELIVDVLCRDQLIEAAMWLVERKWGFEFEALHSGEGHPFYRLTINDICWAGNLVEIAQMLQRFDYDDEGKEEVRDAA